MIKLQDSKFDFWEVNPELSSLKAFKPIQDKFKKKSSQVMWALSFCYHNESQYRNLELINRQEVIAESLLDDEKFFTKNKDLLEIPIKQLIDLFDNAVRRHLRQWETTLDQRTKFLERVEYDFATYEAIDKMSAATSKIYDTFKKIQDDIAKDENGSGEAKGGYKESLNDTGEI